MMVFTRFLSFSVLCEKNDGNLWFDDLWSLGIFKLITTLKIKLKKSIFASRIKT